MNMRIHLIIWLLEEGLREYVSGLIVYYEVVEGWASEQYRKL
jgi:hypothetical protein